MKNHMKVYQSNVRSWTGVELQSVTPFNSSKTLLSIYRVAMNLMVTLKTDVLIYANID